MLSFDRSDVKNKIQNDPHLKMLVKQHGASPYELIEESNWRGGGSLNAAISARAYIKYSNDFERTTGKKLFIAAVGSRAPVVIDQYKKEQEGEYVSSDFVVGRTR